MTADKTIRIDRQVDLALRETMKSQESYNAVLRRILRLDKKRKETTNAR